MTQDWVPNGYGNSQEYHTNKIQVYIIAILLIGVFGVEVFIPFLEGILEYYSMWTRFVERIGISNPVFVKISILVTFVIGVLVGFFVVVTPIHEAIHYGVGLIFDLNPDFGYEKNRVMKNPRVVALSTNIPDWMNLLMIIAPFVIISLLSWGVIQISSGFLAGIAALVLCINSAGSAQDVYHCIRILRMEPGTRFANFEVNGEIRTEYAVPEK